MLLQRRFIFLCRCYHQVVASKSFVLVEPVSLLPENNLKPKSFRECKQLHAKLIVSQCISEVHLTNTLLNLYSKCGKFDLAYQLFDQMPQKNVVTWTTLISAHVQSGSFGKALNMFKKMLAVGESPNQFTFSTVIRASANPTFCNVGLQIHGIVVRFGLESDKFAGSALVYMYFNICNGVKNACLIFNELSEKDRVTWNIMISGFAQAGDSNVVLRLFSEMRVVESLKPDDIAITSLLKCCSSLEEVKQIHLLALKFAAEVDLVVGSALVDMYAKCGDTNSSKKIFDSMEERDTFVWSSIISGYTSNSKAEEAVYFFREMCRQHMKLDQHVLSSTLKACAEIESLTTGNQVHVHMIKYGYQSECFVASVLLALHANFGELEDAEKLFRRISNKDIVAWNSMILAYSQLGQGSSRCMQLLKELRQTTFLHFDGATLTAVLKSCQDKSDLNAGRQIHALILKSSLSCQTLVGNALIHMYSECKTINDAHKAFVDIIWKDDGSWSSIIGTYQQNGMELKALKLCKHMLDDGITFTSYSLPICIVACSELSAIEVGKQFHGFVIKSGFNSDVYAGSSIIDMYAKSGNMEESEQVFGEQSEPNEVTYNAMISGYAQHGKVQKAIELFSEMDKKGLVPNDVTFLAVLSACSHAGHVENSLYFFNLMHHKYKIKPESEHYSCLVDCYGRTGKLEEAYQLVLMDGSKSAWRTLLSACRNYGSREIAEKSAIKLMELNPSDHASYVLLSNMYTEEGKWEAALQWRTKMAKTGVKKDPGSSWLI